VTAALRRSTLSLSIPNYRRWFAGQIVSISGNWMQTVAEMWLVVHLTGSGVAVGITAALQFLPILLFGALGGVQADRRSSLIAITPDGRELMRVLRTRKDAYLAQRLRKLSAEDRETLDRAADLLERLLEEDPA